MRPIDVACPVCFADPGMSCAVTRPRRGDWSRVGELRAEPHHQRVVAARRRAP